METLILWDVSLTAIELGLENAYAYDTNSLILFRRKV